MTGIKLTVRNRIASVPDDVEIILDNTDYTITLDLDEEWSGYASMTVRLVNSYGDIQNLTTTTGTITVGKFTRGTYAYAGVYAGDLRTTTPAMIPLRSSIISSTAMMPPPTPDVYADILAKLNGFSATVTKSGTVATITIVDPTGTHTATVTDGTDGTEVEANPTLAGTEADLTGLKVGETKYKVPSGGGGLPAATTDGTVAVYKNGAWVAQTGYGFTKQSASTVTWDGSTAGKQSVTIDNVTYYKIADVPQRSTMPDTIKCTTNTGSVGYGTEAGATGGAVYPVGSFVVIAATTTTIQLEGDTMTFPETGVYAQKYGTTHFSSIEFPAEYQKIDPGMVPGAFRVTITSNDDDESFSCDKTSGEIYKAYTEGRMIECVYDSGSGVISVLNPCAINSEACVFTLQNVANTKSLIYAYSVYDEGSVTEDSAGVDLLNAGITSLQTTNKTIVGAINELKARIDALSGT